MISQNEGTYFAHRDQRQVLTDVIETFPFPLALTYARLQDEMDRQEPIAAAWALRDAFESLLKFCACLAVADALQAEPDAEAASELVGNLFTPQGLSLGHWHTLIETALKAKVSSPRRLADLTGVFFTSSQGGLRKSRLNRLITGDASAFTAWRNRVFGHGVFQVDRRFYAEQTLGWLPSLHAFYDALRPVLAGWRLVSLTPGDEAVLWQGSGHLPPGTRHRHVAAPDPLPMVLEAQGAAADAALPLTPFLSIQRCTLCEQPAAFFFDRNTFDREKPRHRSVFLEYLGGHIEKRAEWPPVVELGHHLRPGYVWKRGVFDNEEVVEGVQIVFRDFDAEYRRPDYLADAIWRTVDEQPGGYLHVVGPGGIGKTFLVRGLEAEGQERGAPVLAYHVLPGDRTDIQTFVSQLDHQARAVLRFGTPQVQLNVASFDDLRTEFASVLRILMQRNNLDRLVVAIDALDELPDPKAGQAGIADLLPPVDQLPDGCFVLLTSRDELRPAVQANLDRLRASAPTASFITIRVSPDVAGNRALLRAYLAASLPVAFRSSEHIEVALERTGGLFLNAFHIVQALAAGVFPDVDALPEANRFYPAYLERLRARVGRELYDSVYLPTLMLLAAAYRPVTLEQLQSWGIPGDRLRSALLDLRDFLRVHRVRRWHESLGDDTGENRYEIAHEAFIRFVRDDPALATQLRAAHRTIGGLARDRHAGRWEGADPTEESDLYDLRFALVHLEAGGDREEAAALRRDETYAAACWAAGSIASDRARFHLAVDLYGSAIAVYRHLRQDPGSARATELAAVLTKNGIALRALGRPREAVAAYDEAIALYRPLLETRPELANELATTLTHQGAALRLLGQRQEAVTAYEEALALRRPLLETRPELVNDLATTLTSKGIALRLLGDEREALAAYDEAIALRRSIVNERPEQADDLATTLTNKGAALRLFGLPREALAAYDEAIALYRPLLESRPDLANRLAAVLTNKAIALRVLGRPREAVVACDEAIAIRRPLVHKRPELADKLATTLTSKGIALRVMGRLREAVAVCDEAIGLYRPLLESRPELGSRLATALTSKGIALRELDEPRQALAACDEALSLYRPLFESRPQLADDLALTLTYRGVALRDLGEPREALAAYDEAIALCRPLLAQQPKLTDDLALALTHKGVALGALGQPRPAVAAFDEAVRLYEADLEAEMTHLLPELLRTIRYWLTTHFDHNQWVEAGALAARALDHASASLAAGAVSEAIEQEVDQLIALLAGLTPADRDRVLAAMGNWAGPARQLLASRTTSQDVPPDGGGS